MPILVMIHCVLSEVGSTAARTVKMVIYLCSTLLLGEELERNTDFSIGQRIPLQGALHQYIWHEILLVTEEEGR